VPTQSEPVTRLSLKVVPGASGSGIAGWLGDRLKVRVQAPAESGRANTAVRELLATALGLPASSVVIVAGGASPRKTVEISALSAAEVRERLAVKQKGIQAK
jgi:uncharacterized protein (TIGR00251 family)